MTEKLIVNADIEWCDDCGSNLAVWLTVMAL